MLLFHGGGWVIGDLLMAEAQSRQLANRAGCTVVSVDYRLAPEHPYPAPVDDAYTALEFVATEAGHFGIDADRLAVYGQSAGGNLAAVVSLMTRDRGGPGIVLQVPVYPVIDADFCRPSYLEWGDGPGLTREQMEWFWDNYIGDGDRRDPYVSPLHAESLAGVAPALVVTAEADPLCSEGRAYADRLRADGVSGDLLGIPRHAPRIHRAHAALPQSGAGTGRSRPRAPRRIRDRHRRRRTTIMSSAHSPTVPTFLQRCSNDEFVPPPLSDPERAAARWLRC